MNDNRIPRPVIAIVSQVIPQYFSHGAIDRLFRLCDAPGDPPNENKEVKTASWLETINKLEPDKALYKLGILIQEFMEVDRLHDVGGREPGRKAIRESLAKANLSYHNGGTISALGLSATGTTLEDAIRRHEWASVNADYDRAIRQITTDPAAAVTAACAILESVCKVLIEQEQLGLPNKEALTTLWPIVQRFLGLDPAKQEDKDIQKILTGLISLSDGIACLRTHASSAHGRGLKPYKLSPRHARLAVGGAHTLAMFVIETWEERKKGSSKK